MLIRIECDGSPRRIPASDADVARGLLGRLVGLIGRRDFHEGCALIIPGCRQVHTFFMRFPIDVVFLDAENRVLSMEPNVNPYRVTGYCRGATMAVELPAGTCAEHGLQAGDVLSIDSE